MIEGGRTFSCQAHRQKSLPILASQPSYKNPAKGRVSSAFYTLAGDFGAGAKDVCHTNVHHAPCIPQQGNIKIRLSLLLGAFFKREYSETNFILKLLPESLKETVPFVPFRSAFCSISKDQQSDKKHIVSISCFIPFLSRKRSIFVSFCRKTFHFSVDIY